jgi:hypothetical protein
MKTAFLVTSLLLILVANLIMVYYAPNGLSPMEGFQNIPAMNGVSGGNMGNMGNTASGMPQMGGFQNVPPMNGVSGGNMGGISGTISGAEGFRSYFLENGAGADEKYAPIGAFDGVKLSTGNKVSGWRYTAPNEPLTGPEFEPGPDNLFMFKNNQCKPECCGASFSCGGGCVCTTPKQRQYIAGRGGNRTKPEDSA